MGLFSTKCTSTVRLDGKIAVITGCNTGIGKITAKDFFLRGARVIMACRNVEKAQVAMEEIKAECKDAQNVGEVKTIELDLGSLESIRTCASEIIQTENRLDLLINNAGVMACPYDRTKDGFELQFGTNHLGHFLFTMLLLPKIITSQPSRIVNVASLAHINGTIKFDDLNWQKRSYSPSKAYAQSKLANILFTRELAKRLKENGIQNVTTYSLHPGIIKTELGRHLGTSYFSFMRTMFNVFSYFFKTPEQGAQTSIHCAVSDDVLNQSGEYFYECKRSFSMPAANDMLVARRLWDESVKLVGLDENYNPFKQAN